MKAIICATYGSPDVLRLADVERPMPRPNDVLIKVLATTVTASDCIVRGFKVPVAYGFRWRWRWAFRRRGSPSLGWNSLARSSWSAGRSVLSREAIGLLGLTVSVLAAMPSTSAYPNWALWR